MARRRLFFGLGAGRATVVAAAVTVVLLTPDADAAIRGNNGRIAFERESAGNVDIYVVPNPPRSPPAPLTPVNVTPGTPGSRDTSPAWAPRQSEDELPLVLALDSDRPLDGSTDREIYLLEFDSEDDPSPETTPLTNNAGRDDTELAWAPAWPAEHPGPEQAGTRPPVAFVRNVGTSKDIFIRTFDSPEPVETNITASPANESAPDWSLDGEHLAFERSTPTGGSEIWVVRVNYVVVESGPDRFEASDPRNVTPNQPPSFAPSWFHYSFVPNEPSTPGDESPSGPVGDPTTCGSGGAEDACLFAPADRIAYSGPDEQGDSEIYFAGYEESDPLRPYADPARTTTWQLTDNGAADAGPVWAPQGDPLGFHTNRGGRFRLYRMYQDDEEEQPLPIVTPSDADDRNASWQALPLSASVVTRRPCGRASTRRSCRRITRASAAQVDTKTDTAAGCPADPTACEQQPPDRCTQRGTARRDTLRGTRGRDVLCGLGGDDVLVGRAGADLLLGGAGDDRMTGGQGPDRLRGGAGRDRMFGGAGVDVLEGGAAADLLNGGPGVDGLFGQAGRDVIQAADGARDRIVGGRGVDTGVLDRREARVRGLERRRR